MTGPDLTRVAHIVPAMVIGGVEVGIARSHDHLNESIDYRIFYVLRRGDLNCGQQHVIKLLWTCLTGRWRPSAVVTSLWWSHPFGVLLGLFRVTWIAFFHNCGFTGRIQKAILRSAWMRAPARLVDSEATGRFFREYCDRDYKIVPYIFPDSAADREWSSRRYDLIWVGRPVAAKRTDLVAELLRGIGSKKSGGRICLIVAGDVPEEFSSLDPGPGWAVDILQSLDSDGVLQLLADSRFFVLASDFEGMSMTTIEAIFAGCVPVVRLVGELQNYVGGDYELVIKDGTVDCLPATADRVCARWLDEAFAETQVDRMKGNIAGYSTYEREFLSAVLSSRRNPSAE